jgi:PAS domain S-box-containing protein
MTQAQDALTHQCEQLRRQHETMLSNYRALQSEVEHQRAKTAKWLEQRTAELQAEAREQKRARTLQEVFYRIAERATAGLTFFEFSRVVHELLGELIYARNFFVCLYNVQKNTLDFPYYVDERDGDTLQCSDVPYRRGLTEFVLRSGQPQRIDAARFAQLQSSGDITEATGDLSFSCWMGVPMPIRGVIGGVLAVQRYDAGNDYTASDADILSFVANHFSNAIERYQTIEELRKSEWRYRTIIEKVDLGVVVIQGGQVVFANPCMANIVGHPIAHILTQPLTAFLHPDDVTSAANQYAKRQRGEALDPQYPARIIDAQGQTRWLEFSAVPIDWNRRPATLLFAVDATERRQAEYTQREALQRQTELNAMKSGFIAMASHEFRTPLATIHGSLELLRHYEERLSVEQKFGALQKIDEAVLRMTRTLETVLLIGSAESRQLAFEPTPMGLTAFIRGLVDELHSSMSMQLARITLALDLPAPEAMFWLDENLLRNILGNLISNAVKYARDGTEVQVQVRANTAEQELIINVIDQGIGIPADDLPYLFERFHRASNVGMVAGTGLGLSIVKDAVAAHHGSIQVQSQVGVGSCFTVSLPLQERP